MPARSRRFAAVSMAACLALVGVACSDDDGGDAAPTTEADATTTEGSDGASTQITAVDYGFEGVPDSLPAGPHTFDFTNEGEEPHELVVFKIIDPTETMEELLALPEEEGRTHVEEAGGTFAPAGEDADEQVEIDLEAGGKYAFVCFIPVGTTGESEEEAGDGPPHFMEGMVHEFTVEEA